MFTVETIMYILSVIGCGVTSWFIGHRDGIRLGAETMYDHLTTLGTLDPDDNNKVIVKLEINKDD